MPIKEETLAKFRALSPQRQQEILSRMTPATRQEMTELLQGPQESSSWGANILRGIAAPFEFAQRNIITPFAAAVTSPFTPKTEGTEGLNWLQREIKEYHAADLPSAKLGFNYPSWLGGGEASIGVKGALEELPWMIPAAAPLKVIAGGARVAGFAGAAAKVGAAAEKVSRVERLAFVTDKLKRVPKAVMELPSVNELETLAKAKVTTVKGARLPGVKAAVKLVSPAAVADNPTQTANVIAGMLDDMIDAGTAGLIVKPKAARTLKGAAIKVVDDVVSDADVLFEEGQSKALHDIIENAGQYTFKSQAKEDYVKSIRAAAVALTEMGQKEGILVNPKYVTPQPGQIKMMTGEPGFVYLKRVVMAVKETELGNVASDITKALNNRGLSFAKADNESSWAFVQRLAQAAKNKEIALTDEIDDLLERALNTIDVKVKRQRMDKMRFYETVSDGLAAGVKYSDDPVQELEVMARALYERVKQKRVGDYLVNTLETTTTAELVARQIGQTPAELGVIARQASHLDAALGRMKREGKLPGPTMTEIRKNYPEIGARLDEIKTLKVPDVDKLIRMNNRELFDALAVEPEYLTRMLDIAPEMLDEAIKARPKLAMAFRNRVASITEITPDFLLSKPKDVRAKVRDILTKYWENVKVPAPTVLLRELTATGLLTKQEAIFYMGKIYEGALKDTVKQGNTLLSRVVHEGRDIIAELNKVDEAGLSAIMRGNKVIPKEIYAEQKRALGITTRNQVEVVKAIVKARNEAIDALKPFAKAEVKGTRRAKASAQALMGSITPAEYGVVEGVPGISGRVITSQIINGKNVAGRDIANEIKKTLGFRAIGPGEEFVKKVGAVGGFMRMAKASMDLSVQLIQTQAVLGMDVFNAMAYPGRLALKEIGIFEMARKPTADWAKGAYHSIRAAFDKQIEWEAKYWARPEKQWFLQEAAKRGALIQPSEYMESFGPVLSKVSKLPVIGKFAEPLVKQTWGRAEAAFSAGRNITANEMRISMWRMAELDGKLPEMIKASNLFTGVMSTRGMGVAAAQRSMESGIAFFSPRYTRSVGAIMGHILWNPSSYTGAQALQALTGMMVGANTFFTSAALALGQKPKIDPRPKSQGGDGAEYGTVEIGGRNIGIGGLLTDIRVAFNLVSSAVDSPDDLVALDMSNPVFRRLRGKFAPPTSAFYDYISGRDYLGDITRGEGGMPTTATGIMLGKWGLPIWVEAAVIEGAPLVAVITEFFGGRQFPEGPWDIYNNLLLQKSGKQSLSQISSYEKQTLEESDAELKELKEAARQYSKEKGWNPIETEFWERRSQFDLERQKTMVAIDAAYKEGQLPFSDVRDLIKDANQKLGNSYNAMETDPKFADVIEGLEKKAGQKTFAEDVVWVRYNDILYDPKYVNPTGEVDYNAIEKETAKLQREVGPEIWNTVEERIANKRKTYPETVQKYYELVDTLQDYWEVRTKVMAALPVGVRNVLDKFQTEANIKGPEWESAVKDAVPDLKGVLSKIEKDVETVHGMMRKNPKVNQAVQLWYQGRI